jgi:NAD(P)-dependent dehydrogenase (short-subunit alcohol dehydrogenase family)
MTTYQGKKIVITGGTSGMGLRTAKYFLDGGARVLLTGRSPSTIEDARGKLGAEVLTARSDTSVLADTDALGEQIRAELGSIDLLFVNAGVTQYAPFESTTEEVYDRLSDINVKGAYFTVQKLAPLIADNGAIVFTTSVVNVKGLAGLTVYSLTKAAVRSMTRTFARELLSRGIRVNAISPGPIDTGILDRSMPAEAAEQTKAGMKANNPMGRFGTSEEIAKAVAFLGFDATFTTGAELTVDGGASQL